MLSLHSRLHIHYFAKITFSFLKTSKSKNLKICLTKNEENVQKFSFSYVFPCQMSTMIFFDEKKRCWSIFLCFFYVMLYFFFPSHFPFPCTFTTVTAVSFPFYFPFLSFFYAFSFTFVYGACFFLV